MLTIIRQTLLLIEKNDRTRFFGVVVLGLFTTALDTMGILSVFPFLQLATKPEIVQSNSYLRTVFQFFHFSSVQNFLILVGIAMLFFFSLANAIKGFSLWYSNIFIYRCNQKISVKLLSLYFRENYLLNIKKNSAEVATQLLSYVDLGMSSMLHAILGLISSVLLVLSLLSILFYTQPYSALIMFLSVGVLYFILDKSIKFQLVELGQKSMSNSKNLYKSINESTGGVKEIKYLNRAHKFLEDYNQIYGHYVDLKSKSNVLQFLPKLIIDSLAFASGILMIILMIMNGSQLSESLPTLGLFAFIILRLVPNAQVILQQTSKIRYSEKSVQFLSGEMDRLNLLLNQDTQSLLEVQKKPIDFQKSLQFHNVDFRYDDHNLVIKKLNFQLLSGETIAFVGKTGSGKTTIIDLILGLIHPTHGSITVDGEALTKENLPLWQRNIGYVPQNVFLADTTIEQNIAYGIPLEKIDSQRIIEVCRQSQIHDYISEKLPQAYQTVVGERGVQLSGGQKQRIGIARALYHDPKLLVLDEATSALDDQTEESVMQEIQFIAKSKTVILIAHRLSTIKSADRIYMLKNGEIASVGNFQHMLKAEPDFFSKHL